jgi:hypothetical protein
VTHVEIEKLEVLRTAANFHETMIDWFDEATVNHLDWLSFHIWKKGPKFT